MREMSLDGTYSEVTVSVRHFWQANWTHTSFMHCIRYRTAVVMYLAWAIVLATSN